MPEITEPTKDLVESVIETKNLDALLNLKEMAWFEFRQMHYATTAPNPGGFKAKYELAKDCSSIANSGGGYIFIGLKPAILESQMTEYVEAIVGVTKADINLASWRDSLMNLLTPRFTLEDIEHDFIDIDDTKSVFWMRIPSAREKGVYPLMLHKDQAQDGEHTIKGKVVGVYERYGAENELLSATKIQGYIAQGIAAENDDQPFAQDISRIESKLDRILEQNEAGDTAPDSTERLARLNSIARQKVGDNEEEAYFYIYAAPLRSASVPNFWLPNSDQSSVAWLIKNPPTLRNMGWDLSVAMQEQPTAEPGAWEIMNGNRKLVRLTDKGEVFAAVTINNFLSWGMDNPSQQANNSGFEVLINEYAFSEFIAMYFSMVEKMAQKLEGEMQYQVVFGFVGTDGLSVGLHEPIMAGIPSNGTLGPMRTPSTWRIDEVDPTQPYINAGFVIQELTRSGFGGTQDSQYFTRENGHLVFDETSYANR